MKITLLSSLLASAFVGAFDSSLPSLPTSPAPVTGSWGQVDGYVCEATYTRQANVAFGNTGFALVLLTAQPACGGASLGSFAYKSPGGAAQGYEFSENERLALFEQAKNAARDGMKVTLYAHSSGGIQDTVYHAN